MSFTRLWMRAGADGVIEWLCRDAQGRLIHGPAVLALQDPPLWPRADERVLVWADESLVLRRAPLPASGRAKWRTGLPYLAEDWVAGDVADLHVVAPQRLSGDSTWVAVVETRRLDTLLQTLRATGLEPDRVIPEAAFLGPGRSADVLLDAGHASFVSSAGLGGSCEADLLDMMAGEPLEQLRILSTGDDASTRAPGSRIDTVLRWLSLQVLDDSFIDLRQGSYATKAQQTAGGGWWRVAAALLLAAVLVHLGILATSVWRLSSQEQALSAELEGQFRQVFGPEARMVDPAFQIRSELARLGQGGPSGAEVITLLKGIAPLLASDSRLVLRSFQYSDGALEVTVSAPDAARFEGLREQVRLNPALKVEVGSTQIDGTSFTGRLRIERSAG